LHRFSTSINEFETINNGFPTPPHPQLLVDTTTLADNTAVLVEVWRRKYGTMELDILSAHVEFCKDGACETFL